MRALLLLAVCGGWACGGGADHVGLTAWLRVPGAQFVPRPLPQAGGGPSVSQAFVSGGEISPGLVDRTLQAFTAPGTSGILLGIEGDAGYWVLPAGPPDVQQANQQKTVNEVDFSSLLPPGQFNLIVLAVSSGNVPGAAFVVPLQTQGTVPLAADGLSFTLSWNTESDLDLHVVDPAGNEIYWNRITADGGLLDFDSNQSCIIDGRRRESVTWTQAAPSGHYRALVDTTSLCSAASATWILQARRGDTLLATVHGESTHFDTRGAHARGAGLLALELDVP